MKLLKVIPFFSKLDDDYLDIAIWESDENICDLVEPSRKCTNTTEYFGTSDSREPKFCPHHFFGQVVSGNGIDNYKLVHEKEVPKYIFPVANQ